MSSYRLHRYSFYIVFVWLLISQLIGCDDDNDSIGPCVHIYENAVLRITLVRDGQTNDTLGSVILTDFLIDGGAVSASQLIEQFGDNAQARGDSLVCTPPCGFGTQEGHYDFTSTSPGYVPKLVSLDVAYAEFEGGCPSFNRGGMEVEINLEPR